MSVSHSESNHSRRLSAVGVLELGDGVAHLFVASLLLVLAVAILGVSTYEFVHDLIAGDPQVSFAQSGLSYLSNLLLGVIVLELLSTILTYIQARNLGSTIKDFLVVGLISSVRKILLTGAQSSLHPASTSDFVQESIGTVITIVGICLLIGGLIFLDRQSTRSEAEIAGPD
jgi:uncharacterized membrane protein (DUF373 family)